MIPRPGTKPPTKVINALADERVESFSYFNEVDLWSVKIKDVAIPIIKTTEQFEAFIDSTFFDEQ